MPDYSNSCIYKLCCKDPSIKECYVGSTINFTRRKSSHKHNCIDSNVYVYEFIREHGGWDNFDMVLIEKVSVNDKKELHAKERESIEKLGASLNCKVPNRSQKEWCEDNPEKVKEKMERYKTLNKEKIAEKMREYNLENKEKLAEYKKKYNLENKEKIAEKKKLRYFENREKFAEKITCECGLIMNNSSLLRHIKTKKHVDLMAQLNEG